LNILVYIERLVRGAGVGNGAARAQRQRGSEQRCEAKTSRCHLLVPPVTGTPRPSWLAVLTAGWSRRMFSR